MVIILKLKHAIKMQMKEHQTSLTVNEAQFNQCNNDIAQSGQEKNTKKSTIEDLQNQRSASNAKEMEAANKQAGKEADVRKIRSDMETGEGDWQRGDAARKKEIGELDVLVKAIRKAIEAFNDANSS